MTARRTPPPAPEPVVWVGEDSGAPRAFRCQICQVLIVHRGRGSPVRSCPDHYGQQPCPSCGQAMTSGRLRCRACTNKARRVRSVRIRNPSSTCVTCAAPVSTRTALRCRGCHDAEARHAPHGSADLR